MIVPIPGFGGNAVAPTPELILKLRNIGVFQDAIKYFAGRAHFHGEQQPAGSNPWPITGSARPQYWAHRGWNRAPRALFIKQDEDGTYPSKKPNRSDITAPEAAVFNQSMWAFYDDRPQVQIPVFSIRDVSYIQWSALNMPEFEIEDPEPYPIAEIQANQDPSMMPWNNLVFFMESGIPYVATMSAALAKFPYRSVNTPVVSASSVNVFTGSQVVGVARALLTASANRTAAAAILNSADSDETRAARLAALR